MSFGPRNLVTLILVLLVPAVVFGEVPDIDNCQITTLATADVSIMICPACDGNSFGAAFTFGGDLMVATIQVIIANNVGQPLEGIAADTIWIDADGVNWCTAGNISDYDTDVGGLTEFILPPCGGGCSTDYLNGYLLIGSPTPFNENPLSIKFNSPDTNGDLVVDLIDLAAFAEAYFLPATYCFDYYWDGAMTLQDLALFSQHYTHACPGK